MLAPPRSQKDSVLSSATATGRALAGSGNRVVQRPIVGAIKHSSARAARRTAAPAPPLLLPGTARLPGCQVAALSNRQAGPHAKAHSTAPLRHSSQTPGDREWSSNAGESTMPCQNCSKYRVASTRQLATAEYHGRLGAARGTYPAAIKANIAGPTLEATVACQGPRTEVTRIFCHDARHASAPNDAIRVAQTLNTPSFSGLRPGLAVGGTGFRLIVSTLQRTWVKLKIIYIKFLKSSGNAFPPSPRLSGLYRSG